MEQVTNRAGLLHAVGALFRKKAVLGMCALLAVTSVSAAQSLVPLRVGKAGGEAFSFIPADIGVEKGIFEKHGLNVTVSTFAGGPKIQQGLAADAIDIGLGSGPEMVSLVKGSPAKAVTMMMGPPALLVLVARNDGQVNGIDDLKGKRVAVSGLTSLTAWLVKEASRQKGWGPDGIELVAAGDQLARIAALKTEQVDGMVIDIATALAYEKAGDGKVLERFGTLVDKFHNHVIFATDKIIAEQPEAVESFLAGWFETINWMASNREETIEMAARMMNVDGDVAAKVYDELMPTFSRDGRFDSEALSVLANSYVELGSVDTPPDMTAHYTEEFLPSAD